MISRPSGPGRGDDGTRFRRADVQAGDRLAPSHPSSHSLAPRYIVPRHGDTYEIVHKPPTETLHRVGGRTLPELDDRRRRARARRWHATGRFDPIPARTGSISAAFLAKSPSLPKRSVTPVTSTAVRPPQRSRVEAPNRQVGVGEDLRVGEQARDLGIGDRPPGRREGAAAGVEPGDGRDGAAVLQHSRASHRSSLRARPHGRSRSAGVR